MLKPFQEAVVESEQGLVQEGRAGVGVEIKKRKAKLKSPC